MWSSLLLLQEQTTLGIISKTGNEINTKLIVKVYVPVHKNKTKTFYMQN